MAKEVKYTQECEVTRVRWRKMLLLLHAICPRKMPRQVAVGVTGADVTRGKKEGKPHAWRHR